MYQELTEQIVKTARDACSSYMHTLMPAEIVKYYPEKGLVDLKPIGSYYSDWMEMEYPVIPGIPIASLSNPNSDMAVCSPIKEGDKVLYAVTEQSISAFLTGTNTDQSDERYELQNGFAVLRAQDKPIEEQQEANDEDAVIFRKGDVKVKITKDKIAIKAKDIEIEGDIALIGNLSVTGDVTATGKVSAESVSASGGIHASGTISSGTDVNWPGKGKG